jgi:glutamine amidotransferase
MPTVVLIDYGAGNLTSVMRGLRRAGLDPSIAASPTALGDASGIVVPGVGHFSATASIDDAWREALLARVRAGVPLLGICLGMQWLFEGSTEAPGVSGLGLAPGLCDALDDLSVKVPHLGWNRLASAGASQLLAGVEPDAYAYFAHSYAAPVGPDTVATTTHGATFASVIERDNIFGAQFHPELSSDTGAVIFANFARSVTR